jgi:hypothetical protein
MTPEEITAHLQRYRQMQDRHASEEKARLLKEEEVFRESCRACESAMHQTVEPLLQRLHDLLGENGHPSVLRGTQEMQQTTERTQLKSLEYSASIAVERPKGILILRMVAVPQTRQISATIGVPHGNCSSVFHAANGPLSEAEEATNRGIADFMVSAFPTR